MTVDELAFLSNNLILRERDLERRLQVLERKAAPLAGTPEESALAATIAMTARLHTLPELRGGWPMATFDTTSDLVADISGYGRSFTAINTPTTVVVSDSDVDVGAIRFTSAQSERLRIADAAWNSVTGDLSAGGWFRFINAASTVENLIAKWNATGNQRSWRILRNASGEYRVLLSSDGIATSINLLSTAAPAAGVWFFMAFSYQTSTRVDLVVNTTVDSTTTSVPASLFDSTSDLEIGAINSGGGEFADMQSALAFLCASPLGVNPLLQYYEVTKAVFGV